MEIEKVCIGNVVMLNSGGPLMTVNSVDRYNKRVYCNWFDSQNSLCGDYFRVSTIQEAKNGHHSS